MTMYSTALARKKQSGRNPRRRNRNVCQGGIKMASFALIAWFSFKIFTQMSPVRYLHSITSGASGATGFTLAQGVVIMAFTYTHIAIPKSRRAKIEVCLDGPIHFGSGATANGSTHSNLLQTQVVDFCERAIRLRRSPFVDLDRVRRRGARAARLFPLRPPRLPDRFKIQARPGRIARLISGAAADYANAAGGRGPIDHPKKRVGRGDRR